MYKRVSLYQYTNLTCFLYTVPTPPITSLIGVPSLSQINVTWTPPIDDSVGIFIVYEVRFLASDGSVVIDYTNSPTYTIKGRNHSTSYNISVTPFSLLTRGKTVEQTVETISEPRKPQFVLCIGSFEYVAYPCTNY